jgi:hypothetical protein
MCIAILQKPNSRIKKKTLKTCYYNNPDSMGILWVEDGKLRTHKELLHFENFYNVYDGVCNRVGKKSNVVLHFRIATHGLIDVKNCHPHFVSKNIAFVHNGIIPIESDGLESDTVAFNKTILKGLPQDDFLDCDSIFKLIDGFAFDSKFIFLSKNNRYRIVGDSEGEWIKGVWYSNSSYKHYKTYITSTKYDSATSTTSTKVIDRVNHFNDDENYSGDGFGSPYSDYFHRYKDKMFNDDDGVLIDGRMYQCLCCNEQTEYLPIKCSICNGSDFEPIYIKDDSVEGVLEDGFSVEDGNVVDDISQEEMEMIYLAELEEMEKSDRLELENLKANKTDGRRCKKLEKYLLDKVKKFKSINE